MHTLFQRLFLAFLFCLSAAAQLPVRPVDGTNETMHISPAGTKTRYLMQAVPNSSTTVTASTIRVQVIICNNQTASAATVTITDNAGSPRTYYPTVSLAANSVAVLYAGAGFTMEGIKWTASAATTIYCQIEGVI